MSITSLKSRFKQLKTFENIFGFLFNSNRLKSLDDNNLMKSCANFHSTFSYGDSSDVDLYDVILHIFTPEDRKNYDLDRLYIDIPQITL